MTAPAPHIEPPFRPVAAREVATWPVGSFVENIVALPEGDFVVTVHSAAALHRVDRHSRITPLATLPEPGAGIVFDGGHLFVAGGTIGTPPGRIWRVALGGTVEPWLEVPGALFLNGFTLGRPGRAFAVDSLLGAVFEIDLVARLVREWFRDERLAKASSEPLLPGVNGIKRFGEQLALTNTDRAEVLTLGIRPDGAAGQLKQLAAGLRGDDIAFDATGRLYVTTHIHNTLVRLDPDGTCTAIAGPEEGMAGATACAFGRAAGDETGLYVTTTGGVVMPYRGVPQPAKLVRLETGAAGHPVGFDGRSAP